MSEIGRSTYAEKRRSGNMMYGPVMMPPPYPEFKSGSKKCLCRHRSHQLRGITYEQCERMQAVRKSKKGD